MNNQSESTTKTQQCMQCQTTYHLNALNFMAEFNAYVCKQCYEYQSNIIMQYKKAKPKLFVEYDQIQEGLYLGNQDAACDEQTFTKTGVSAVCACGGYLLTPFEHKYDYKKYQIADCPQQKILDLFEQNFEWIMDMKKQNKKILVHCAAGVSRSASFVIAYIMRSRKLSYLQAHEYVKSKRPIVRPNSGFVKQLYEYEKVISNFQMQKLEKQQKS